MSSAARLIKYMGRHRGAVIWATVCSVINKVFDIAPEVLIGVAVDVVVSRHNSFLARMGFQDPMTQIVALAALTALIWILESLFEYFYQVAWRNLSQTVEHELRQDAYRHVQDLDMQFFDARHSTEIASILSDDINQLERFLDVGASELIQTVVNVVVVSGIFFYLAPSVAVLALAPIPVILFGAFWFRAHLEPRYATVREQAGRLASRIASNLSGLATIKAFTAEAHELVAVTRVSDAYQQANRRTIILSSAFIPIIRMAILAGFLATLVQGGRLTFAGELAIGSYSVLVFLTQRLLWPFTRLAQTVDLYQRAMASTDRVLNLLKFQVQTRRVGRRLERVTGSLELSHVGFAYPERSPLFADLSLKIPAGQTVALVGSTGSGKSTLVKLLLRLYEANSGTIRLDGEDVQEIDLGDLRRAVSYVSQDVFLFDGTLRANIAFGMPDTSLESVIEAAKVAEAHEFIMQLPEAYDTLVGERGLRLSGGQRQRVSIARAVLKNSPILVFDEATSAVDNETEAAIQRSLSRLVVGRTAVIVAHRLSTIRHAHSIVVLEQGRIVEMGDHSALLEKRGAYAALWKVQTGE